MQDGPANGSGSVGQSTIEDSNLEEEHVGNEVLMYYSKQERIARN